MNFHILLVHFPIALLTLYTAMEVVRVPFFSQRSWWSDAKVFILWTGALFTVPTIIAGWVIHEPYEQALPELVGAHMTFALLSAGVFAVLAGAYVIRAFEDAHHPVIDRMKQQFAYIWAVKRSAAAALTSSPLVQLLALAGFTCLLITGALGGALAHGSDVDPFVSFIYGLIVK